MCRVGKWNNDTEWNAGYEGADPGLIDADRRRRGDQTGLETPVVRAVNHDY